MYFYTPLELNVHIIYLSKTRQNERTVFKAEHSYERNNRQLPTQTKNFILFDNT
jgi:hypothetical protein